MKPRVGVWRAVCRLGNLPVRNLLWPELIPATAIGVGGAIVSIQTARISERLDLVNTVLPIAGVLLTVVFAALALVVSIPSRDYLRAMAQTPRGGMINFLDPFLLAVGTQTAVVLLAFAYKVAAPHVPRVVEHVAFGSIAFLFVFGVLDVVALARSLVRHGLNRAAATLDDPLPADAVPRLDQRRRND